MCFTSKSQTFNGTVVIADCGLRIGNESRRRGVLREESGQSVIHPLTSLQATSRPNGNPQSAIRNPQSAHFPAMIRSSFWLWSLLTAPPSIVIQPL